MSEELMSTDGRIQAIFAAADRLREAPRHISYSDAERCLSDAIDAAMSHAYAEGRDDQKREMEHEALLERAKAIGREADERGQDTVSAIENIWGLPPRSKHAA